MSQPFALLPFLSFQSISVLSRFFNVLHSTGNAPGVHAATLEFREDAARSLSALCYVDAREVNSFIVDVGYYVYAGAALLRIPLSLHIHNR